MLDGGDVINTLCFSPNHHWRCAAIGPSIKIWDLKGKLVVDELKQEVISPSSKAGPPQGTSLAWFFWWPDSVCWLHEQPGTGMAGAISTHYKYMPEL